MYGTVATMRVKPGQEAKVTEMTDRWWRDRAPKIEGAISGSFYKSQNNPGEYILAVVFDSKANYEANSNDPEQDAWYQQFTACLDGEPVWNDGEVLSYQHQH